MTQIQVGRQKLHVQVKGAGLPMVMLHGLLLGNLSSWYLAAGQLTRVRQVVLYDLRGHGYSEISESGYDLESMADDLGGVAEQVAPGEALDLVGYSYGSLIALRFAIAHPFRVRKLVLVEAPLPPLEEIVDRYVSADLKTLLEAVPRGVRDALLSSPRRMAIATQRMKRLINGTTIVQDVRAERPFEQHDIKALEIPTLCIYGQESEFADQGRRLAAALPLGELRVIAGGGHQLLNENAAEISALIQEFIDG